jgi:hypothetical protein
MESMDEWEKKRFQAFLSQTSPPASSPARELWACLNQEETSAELTKEGVFAALWPGEPYHDQRMRDLMSQLYQQLKQFWVMEELQQNEPQARILLLRQLKKRRLRRNFQAEANALRRQLRSSKTLDRNHWQQRLLLAAEEDEFFGLKGVRKADPHLQEKMYALDRYYLIEKFQQACEMVNRQRIIQEQYEMPLLGELIRAFSDSPYREDPVLSLYRQVLLTLQGEAPYQELEQQLPQVANLLAEEEARAIFKYAQNHCIRQSNAGEHEFLSKLFSLYQLELENGLLFRSGEMAHTDFKNVVTVSLRLKAFEWTESFIETYQEKVAEPYRANVYRFSLASLHYEKGEPSQALSQLQGLQFTDIRYQLSARTLLLKVFFDQEDSEAARYSIKAFQAFLKRNKELTADLRQAHLRFLTWTGRLLRLQDQQYLLSKKEFAPKLEGFLQKLTAATNVSNKSWLLAEAREMGG